MGDVAGGRGAGRRGTGLQITESIDKARQELGFEPTPFDNDLAETYQWYLARSRAEAPDFSFEDRLLEMR